MTTFSLRPVSGSDDSRGSSSMTSSSGSGKNSASWCGVLAFWRLTAWKPPECHVLKAMCGVNVGLWAEYDVCGGFQSAQGDGSFSGIRYSASTVGTAGSEMSIIRAQPHVHPCPGPVAVPYTSSETQTQSRPQSLTALWAPGPGHVGLLSFTVIGRGWGIAAPVAKSDTSTTANPPVRSAK